MLCRSAPLLVRAAVACAAAVLVIAFELLPLPARGCEPLNAYTQSLHMRMLASTVNQRPMQTANCSNDGGPGRIHRTGRMTRVVGCNCNNVSCCVNGRGAPTPT